MRQLSKKTLLWSINFVYHNRAENNFSQEGIVLSIAVVDDDKKY